MSIRRKRKISGDLARTLDLTAGLYEDGWHTPDTYGLEFRPAPSSPGVYLFLLYTDYLYHKAQVAYVGMSLDIRRRWSGHEILSELGGAGHWTQRWFKQTSASELREVEASYIIKFNPPWNINGKPRGIIQ